ncbi:MAG: hypothetical protein Q9160_005743 [Pyrenula sp. 1 TL-2023]
MPPNRDSAGAGSSLFQSSSQAYYSAAAAVAEDSVHEQSNIIPAKNEPASQTSSRRGKRFRKSLQAKKAVATKKAAQKQKRQPAAGSLKKPLPRSEREGGNGNGFGHGQRHTSVPLGIRALGQPAKAVIVENQNRTSPPVRVQHMEEAIQQTSDFEGLFKSLAKEDEVLSLEEVQPAIDQLKNTYAQREHGLARSDWTSLRRQIGDGFQAEQLRQYIKTAKEDANHLEKGQSQSTTEKGPSLRTILNETSKSKMALYIMRNVWGLRPRAGTMDDELKLEPNQLQVLTHMTQDTLASLEAQYGVTIDLKPDRSVLSLHHEKEHDKHLTQINRNQAYERLSRLLQDISTRVINLNSMDTSFFHQSHLLKRSYLEHLSTTRETFVEGVGLGLRRKGRPKPTGTRELRIHYLDKSHKRHGARLSEREVNLAFHRAKQRSSTHQWVAKADQLVPIPAAAPDNSSWHQKELKWARLIFPPSTESKEKISATTLSDGVEKIIHRQMSKFIRPALYSQDLVYFGHLLIPRVSDRDGRRLVLGMTPLSTNIPLLAHALSSFSPKANYSVFKKSSRREKYRSRVLFVPSPFCTGDLPSFELNILEQPGIGTTRFVSITAIFHSTVVDLPLPQANCDLRFVRQYLRYLTPLGGLKWATWMGIQRGDALDNLDSHRTLQSILIHLPQAWDEQKKQFSFPPMVDLEVPNAWVRGKNMSKPETSPSNSALSTDSHNSEPPSLGTEAVKSIESSENDASRSNETPGSDCSRFPYICAANNSVNEVAYATDPAQLHLYNHYDNVSETACQELFLRGQRLPSVGSEHTNESRERDNRTIEPMLAQALEYARTFGR